MENIFRNLNNEEKIILYVLGALDNTPIRSKVKLQKILFLISNVFKDYKDLLEFEPHLLGPYSEIVDNVLEDLIKLELVKPEGSNSYKLTTKGSELYSYIEPKKELSFVINDFKNFLNDLPDDYILIFIYSSYPEFIAESAKWDDLKSKRISVAISLLEKEKISFSKAAEISGLSLERFYDKLKELKIRWKNDEQDIG